ncbi:MAG: OB-fold domain-containing protein [Firmicutes bacterium]|nr:OB-fold domain-containing protein [Bacillota bacterium]
MAYTKPRPNIDGDIQPFWEGLKNHQFLLYRCQQCGAWYWPAAFCRFHDNQPFAANMKWEPASGRGRIFTFNVHHWAFDPAFKEDVPYVYALIELDEGPMFGTNIVGTPPDQVRIGQRVEIVFEDYPEEGFTLPKARILEEAPS